MADQTLVNADVMAYLADVDADMFDCAVVDYPWDFQIKTGSGESEFRNAARAASSGCRNRESEDVMFEMLSDDAFPALLAELHRVVGDGGWLLFFADDRFQDTVREAIRQSDGLILRRNWVWTANQMGMGYYGRVSHYPIVTATNAETDRYVTDRRTVFQGYDRPDYYDTAKDPALYAELLKPPVLPTGGRLFEPFCGSAPGHRVAQARNTDYIGVDADEQALTVAVEQTPAIGQQADLAAFHGGDE
jgi:hypothetical protein